MIRHAIISGSDVINIVEYATDISGQTPPGMEAPFVAERDDAGASPGWRYADSQFVDPNPPAPVPARRTITRASFLGLFTQAELISISAASRSDDAINVWLITAQAHDAIDLDDALTGEGLDALVSAQLLTVDRKSAILANEPPA
jgi:hypothetical protein